MQKAQHDFSSIDTHSGMHSMRNHSLPKSKAYAKLLRILLSYGVAGGCLYWVFHDLDFRALLQSFALVNWWWLPPAIVCDLLVYVLAAWEWQILLRPLGRLSLLRTTQAVFAGRFANDVMPVHVGYVVRVYLVSRWTGANIASIAPSLAVERLFDGFWLALGIGLTAIFFHLPAQIARVAEIWTAIIIFGLIAGTILVVRKPRRGSRSGSQLSKTGTRTKAWKHWVGKSREVWAQVLEQLRAIGRSWLLPFGFGLSFVKFVVQGLAFLFLLRAYHFHLPFLVQMAVFLIGYVGLSIPSTPGSVGVFQVFCIAGLEWFHVPRPAATAFSLLAFVTLSAPLATAGFFALAQSGLTLNQIRTEASRWRTEKGSHNPG